MASLGTATLDEGATRAVAHTATETVLALPSAIVGLICALHDEVVPGSKGRGRPRTIAERQQSRERKPQTPITGEHAKTTKGSRNTDEAESKGIATHTLPWTPTPDPRKPLVHMGFQRLGRVPASLCTCGFVTLEVRSAHSLCSPPLS